MLRKRGFTVIEVVVAAGLVLLVGSTLGLLAVRSRQATTTSEAGEAAALVLRTAVMQMQESPPAWLRNNQDTYSFSPADIAALLNRVQNITYNDPSLYSVRVERTNQGNGNAEYTFNVCLRPAGDNICLQQVVYASSTLNQYTPPPPGSPAAPPPSGRATLTLSVVGPAGGAADIRVEEPAQNHTFSRYGLFNLGVSPGQVIVRASPTTDQRYSYAPNIPEHRFQAVAGRGYAHSVNYTCQTGALSLRVVPPNGVSSVQDNVVRLSPGGQEVANMAIVPYLRPQSYTLEAATLRVGNYSYAPSYSPSQEFSVQPCTTATRSVSYRAVTGALAVNINRPAGMSAPASVGVSGPDASMPRTLTSSALIGNLVPGEYRITPQDVLEEGVRYRGSVSPASTVEVEVERETAATVQYRPVSGRLTIQVNAARTPQPTPRVAVQRGSQLIHSINRYGTVTLDDQAPGTYTLQASPVQGDLYTFLPSPSTLTVNLEAGDRLERAMEYAPIDGALRITHNLPGGATPSVRVNGQSVSFTGAQATVPYLSVGSHLVTADPIRIGPYTYAPEPASASVAVRAGQTAEHALNFVRMQGIVRVTLRGLPPGASPDATLYTPAGAYMLNRSGTLEYREAPTGDYRVSANDVVHNAITYRATVSPATATLNAGETLSFDVNYQPINALLQIGLNGLPGGVEGNVRVVRNGGGFAQTITASSSLVVPQGAYTITAQHVERTESTPYGALIFTYAPTPANQSLSVAAGENRSVSITYERQAGVVRVVVENPAGAPAPITVSGPGGFSRNLSAGPGRSTAILEGIPTGRYSATGPPFMADGYTYRAVPASVSGTLAHNDTLSLTLTYAPATGRARVSVSAPSGMPTPTLILYDGENNEVGRFSGLEHTFNNLVPGGYTLRGLQVNDANGFPYIMAERTLRVSAGNETAVSAQYVKQSAFVNLQLEGVPGGATPSITLSGGGGSYTFSSAGRYEVRLGSYNLSAAPINHGGYTYTPVVLPGSSIAATSPGSTYSATVRYVEHSGTVTIDVSGLPAGATSQIRLTSRTTTLTQSCGNGACNFTRVPLGSYAVTVQDYSGNPYSYRGTPTPGTATLAAPGDTQTVAANFAPITGALSLSVSGPGGSPSVVVRNSSGAVVYTLSGIHSNHLVPNLPPGTYRIEPSSYQHGGYTYAAPAVNVSVVAGQTTPASAAYTATTGRLRVITTGLPIAPNFSIFGPQNLTVSSADQSFEVRPGVYTAAPNTRDRDMGEGIIYRYRAGLNLVGQGEIWGATQLAPDTYRWGQRDAYPGGWVNAAANQLVGVYGCIENRSNHNAQLGIHERLSDDSGPIWTASGWQQGLWVAPGQNVCISTTLRVSNRSGVRVRPFLNIDGPWSGVGGEVTVRDLRIALIGEGPSARVAAGETATMYVHYSGTGSVVLNIHRTSANAPINVWFNGTRYTAPGRYVINYLNPGRYPLQSHTTYNHGIAFHPSGPNEVWLGWNEQTVPVDIVYTPENRAALNLSVVKAYYGSDNRFLNSAPPALTLLQSGQPYRTVGVGSHLLSIFPGHAYSLDRPVGYEVEFAASCGWIGFFFVCWERLYWRLDSVRGLPLTPSAGEVYSAQAIWRGKRCYQSGLSWVCDLY